jgi:hypothetical protein
MKYFACFFIAFFLMFAFAQKSNSHVFFAENVYYKYNSSYYIFNCDEYLYVIPQLNIIYVNSSEIESLGLQELPPPNILKQVKNTV